MAGILATISLLGYILFIKRFIRYPIEALPFLVVSFVIVLNYSFAYLSILFPMCAACLIGGIILAFSAPLYLPNNRAELLSDYFTPGFVSFILLSLFFGILAQTIVVFTDWDEVYRWLPLAKLTYLKNGFIGIDYPEVQTTYPPGAALFYYFFLRLSSYSENIISYAQLFLVLSPLVIIFRKFKWPNILDVFLLFTFVLLLLVIIGDLKIGPVGTIYMDTAIGIFFGGILASYYILTNERLLWAYLTIPTMALILLKPMLIPFVMIIATIILSDQILLKKINKKNWLNIGLFSSVVILPMLIFKSWTRLYVAQGDVTQHWGPKEFILALWDKNTILTSEQFQLVLTRFSHAVIKPSLFALAILIIATMIYHLASSENKRRILLSHLILFLGYIAYIVLLLFLYLYVFNAHIATSLNSFDRFMGIYYVGWLLTLLTQVLYWTPAIFDSALQKLTTNAKAWTSYAILILLCGYTSIYIYGHHLQFIAKSNKEYLRYAVHTVTSAVSPLTDESAKIGIVWRDGEGVNPIIAYELLPRRFVTFDNMGSIENFEHEVKNLDYLLVARVNKDFWQSYQEYFPINDKPLRMMPLCLRDKSLKKRCIVSNIPIYLYKVILDNNKLKLRNVLQ